MLEQYKQICKFNELIGNKAGDTDKLENQIQLIVEELSEVQEAYHHEIISEEENVELLRDLRSELCDLIVVTIGAAHMLDVFLDQIEPMQPPEMLDIPTEVAIEYLRSDSWANKVTGINYFIGYAMYMAEVYEFNLENDLNAINVSNMSKFCTTLEEADAAALHFDKLNIEFTTTSSDPKYLGYISTKDQEDINGKYYSKGKLLKPPHWVAAEIV